MKIKLVAQGIQADVWLEEFVRTTVAFALWHHHVAVEQVWIHLDAADASLGYGFARCGIAAETELGPVSAGATGSDPHEAIREAALLLELVLFERVQRKQNPAASRLAA